MPTGPNTPSDSRSTIFFALIALAIGLFYVIVSIVGPTHPKPGAAPAWIGFVCGLAFFLGGCAVLIQTLFKAPGASIENPVSGAPPWLGFVYKMLCLAIVLALGAVATWVAFGPGPRTFSGSGAIFGEKAGRIGFGIGAVIIWSVVAAGAFAKLSQLFRRMRAR
jgi:hypothetical protein